MMVGTSTEAQQAHKAVLATSNGIAAAFRTASRAREKASNERDRAKDAAIRALVSARPLTPAEQATADAATPASDSETDHLKAAFTDLSSALGVDWTGDSAPLLAAARASRLSAEAGKAIAAKGLDDRLTRAVLDLSSVDLAAGADAIKTAVEEAVSRAAFESPSLRVRTQTAPVSGAPHLSGQAGMPQMVDRESLKYMSATEIQQAARAGLIDGVGAAK